MLEKNYTGLIPVNQDGKEVNAEASVTCSTSEEAEAFYEIAKTKLLLVNNWHAVAGTLSAAFQLIDANGNEVNRPVRNGDYFKIDIPGPGSKAGGGYDWAVVEEMKEITKPDVQSIGFRVRPTANPFSNDANVAHFYTNSSTSTFIVTRENNTVLAGIYDRNTKPNEEAESLTDKLRHTTIGISALASFSKIQWQNLVKGLVE